MSAPAYRVCVATGKRRYRTEQVARQAMDRILTTSATNQPCRVYGCRWCGGWHLTSKPLCQPPRRSAAA